MVEFIAPAIAAVLVAVVEALAARDRKEAKEYRKHREEAEKAREELMVSVIECGWASIALSEATAHALQRGHTNGDMESALEYASKVKHKQKELLARQGTHAMLE